MKQLKVDTDDLTDEERAALEETAADRLRELRGEDPPPATCSACGEEVIRDQLYDAFTLGAKDQFINLDTAPLVDGQVDSYLYAPGQPANPVGDVAIHQVHTCAS